MRYCLSNLDNIPISSYSGTRFLSPEIEITQFPDGFRLKNVFFDVAKVIIFFLSTCVKYSCNGAGKT